jgi:hypothetical protein
MNPDDLWMRRKVGINSPDGQDHQIWRFMDFPKFVSMLQKQSLWFTRLDQFLDPYEGMLTKPTAEFFEETKWRGGVHYEKFRKHHCVNCWHMNDYESAAMWELYSKTDGVAIRSSLSRLQQSFPETVPVRQWGIRGDSVMYLDYDTQRTASKTSEGLMMHLPGYLSKRLSFEHEREYRLAIGLEEHERESVGVLVPVLLEKLIERVVVSPTAPPWMVELVRQEVKLYELDLPVAQSDLYSPYLK